MFRRTLPVITAASATLAAFLTPAAHAASLPTTIVYEGQSFDGSTLSAVLDPYTNTGGAWAIKVDTSSKAYIYGSYTGTTPGILYTSQSGLTATIQGTSKTVAQTGIDGTVGINTSGTIAYGPTLSYSSPTSVTGIDTVWRATNTPTNTQVAVEDDSVPGMSGKYYAGIVGEPALTNSGSIYYQGRIATAPAGTLGSQGTGTEQYLFKQTGATISAVLTPSISIANAGGAVLATANGVLVSSPVASNAGWMQKVTLNSSASTDSAFVADLGSGPAVVALSNGSALREGSTVSIADGGILNTGSTGQEAWSSAGVTPMGVNDAGGYVAVGSTDANASFNSVLVVNSVIARREGSAVTISTGLTTLSSTVTDAAINNGGDWAAIWGTASTKDVLLFNGQNLFETGSLIDMNGDGVLNGTDGGVSAGSLISLGLSDAVGGADPILYVRTRLTGGTYNAITFTGVAAQEAIIAITVPEPTSLLAVAGLGVLGLRRRPD